MSDLADGLSDASLQWMDIFADLHDISNGPDSATIRIWMRQAYQAGFHEAQRRLLMVTREEARNTP